jgi:hypothetical protein
MNISDLYHQYQIPEQLAQHMLRVTAVGQFVLEHWIGEYVPEEAIIITLLLHDMGNIVKFKRPFMGDMAAQATKWEVVQDEFVGKYGKTAHGATMKIIDEIEQYLPAEAVSFHSLLQEARPLLDEMGYGYIMEHGYSSWATRILDYADMCVAPQGIVGVDARLDETVERYGLPIEDKTVALRRQNQNILKQFVKDINLEKIEQYDLEEKAKELKKFKLY